MTQDLLVPTSASATVCGALTIFVRERADSTCWLFQDKAAIGPGCGRISSSAEELATLREMSRCFPYCVCIPAPRPDHNADPTCVCEQGHLHSVRELLAAGADTALKVHIVEGGARMEAVELRVVRSNQMDVALAENRVRKSKALGARSTLARPRLLGFFLAPRVL